MIVFRAINKLGSTYICNCDNYFEENPFSKFEYNSFHATVFKKDAHNELVVRKNSSGRILGVNSCATEGECIYGHAYIDRELSKRLARYIESEISDFRVSSLFWEEFVSRHAEDLDMYVREYPVDFLYEFDSIQEIQNIDGLFLESVSGRINKIICEVLSCSEKEIRSVEILQKGLTNILFTFVVKGEKYIFRYPGDSSQFFIFRENEVRTQQIAAKAHVDNTYVYIDQSGIKISKYRDNCKDLSKIYYHDIGFMELLAKQIRKLHEAGFGISDWQRYDYQPMHQTERLFAEASKMKGNLFHIFSKEWDAMKKIYAYTEKDGFPKTMCHNDINADNCLLTDTTFDIIDWEFSGWNDPAYDFGRVIAGYDFDDSDIDIILEAYFGRKATELERLHWIA